ncbi:MAG: cupin domain-containing protein [Gammaproteobacteria bacterium]
MQKSQTFGEITIEEFLEQYWQKKPFLIRQAFPNITPLIPADELAGLACEEGVESRLIIQHDNGEKWDLQHGPFNEEKFSELDKLPSNSNWTLLVQAVDHWLPEAAEFLQQFNFIPNWRADDLMISYANEGGGVGPHYDNYDVFLLQAEGKRRWETGGNFDQNSSRRTDTDVLILDQFTSEKSWVLEPGDMLYLPPQVGHNGVAVGDGCMTYSVGFRAPSHSELLTSFADAMSDHLSNEDRYIDPDLKLQKNAGEISSQTILNIKKIITEYSQNDDLISDWFGRFVTQPKYRNDLDNNMQCSLKDLIQHQKDGGLISRNEGSRFSFVKKQQQISLFVDGNNFECDHEMMSLIELLCENTQFNLSLFEGDQKSLLLIRDLVVQGSLYPYSSK